MPKLSVRDLLSRCAGQVPHSSLQRNNDSPASVASPDAGRGEGAPLVRPSSGTVGAVRFCPPQRKWHKHALTGQVPVLKECALCWG